MSRAHARACARRSGFPSPSVSLARARARSLALPGDGHATRRRRSRVRRAHGSPTHQTDRRGRPPSPPRGADKTTNSSSVPSRSICFSAYGGRHPPIPPCPLCLDHFFSPGRRRLFLALRRAGEVFSVAPRHCHGLSPGGVTRPPPALASRRATRCGPQRDWSPLPRLLPPHTHTRTHATPQVSYVVQPKGALGHGARRQIARSTGRGQPWIFFLTREGRNASARAPPPRANRADARSCCAQEIFVMASAHRGGARARPESGHRARRRFIEGGTRSRKFGLTHPPPRSSPRPRARARSALRQPPIARRAPDWWRRRAGARAMRASLSGGGFFCVFPEGPASPPPVT